MTRMELENENDNLKYTLMIVETN